MQTPLLELKNIGKIYVSEGNVAVGIRGVNLSFECGEFVAVTGKSGSGKSTLLNVISGMDTYEEGELYVEGVAVCGVELVGEYVGKGKLLVAELPVFTSVVS